jgi:hypothetical protein
LGQGGCWGPISRAKRNFIKPRSGILDCVGVGLRGRISRRPDELNPEKPVLADGVREVAD